MLRSASRSRWPSMRKTFSSLNMEEIIHHKAADRQDPGQIEQMRLGRQSSRIIALTPPFKDLNQQGDEFKENVEPSSSVLSDLSKIGIAFPKAEYFGCISWEDHQIKLSPCITTFRLGANGYAREVAQGIFWDQCCRYNRHTRSIGQTEN